MSKRSRLSPRRATPIALLSRASIMSARLLPNPPRASTARWLHLSRITRKRNMSGSDSRRLKTLRYFMRSFFWLASYGIGQMGVLAPVSICNFCAASSPNRNSRRKPLALSLPNSLKKIGRFAVAREFRNPAGDQVQASAAPERAKSSGQGVPVAFPDHTPFADRRIARRSLFGRTQAHSQIGHTNPHRGARAVEISRLRREKTSCAKPALEKEHWRQTSMLRH